MSFHVHDGPPIEVPSGSLVRENPWAQLCGRIERSIEPLVDVTIELSPIRYTTEEYVLAVASVCAWLCDAELVVHDETDLGSEWAAAVEGWSVGL